jgi:transcriptional regulator with XRE-family HTH domain
MEDIVQRIQQIIHEKHLSPAEFADELQIGRPLLSHVLSGRNNPSLQLVIKILDHYPEYTADWLVLGKDTLTTEKHVVRETIAPELFDENNKKTIASQQNFSPDRKPSKNIETGQPEQVIMFYPDSTFECYKLRK